MVDKKFKLIICTCFVILMMVTIPLAIFIDDTLIPLIGLEVFGSLWIGVMYETK